MGKPATPSPSQRAAVRALAAAILQAVTADTRMPHGLARYQSNGHDCYLKGDVEDLLTKLASEVCELEKRAVVTLHDRALLGAVLDLFKKRLPEHGKSGLVVEMLALLERLIGDET